MPWLLVSSFVFAQICSSAADSTRPNILFIYTDDHSYRTVSCYPEAEPWARTPNIDRLAKEGIRFTHAYIGTWCMPSRATMLTGLHQFGVQSMRMEGVYPGCTYDPARCHFWPAEFRKHGYFTAQIGKWHTGTDTGFGRDWDYQIVWNRPGLPENAGNYYYDQLLSFNGAPPKLVKGYSTDNYTQWAEEFIRGQHRDANKPWYLWLCYGGVHSPYTPADRHLDAYPGAKVPTPKDIYPPRPGKPAWEQKIAAWEPGPNGEPVLKREGNGKQVGDGAQTKQGRTLSDWVRQYNQGVLALDEGVARLLKALDESGQRRNTLIVFTSDQGFAWGQHGFRHKLAPYDANIRSPLIISMPGTLPENKVCTETVGGADLVPTFFHFAGVELPWAMHGHDLTAQLKNPSAKWPHATMMTFSGDQFGADTDRIPTDAKLYFEGVAWYVLLTEGRYKYIRSLVEGEIEELYDLESDPEELTNLALDKKHSTTLAKFRDAAIKELKRTNAGYASALPKVGTVVR